nr:hypothetical protein [Anaerolineae bacterium]
ERALQLAHRVSINLEAPNPDRLGIIAPQKDFFGELARPMRIAKRLIDDSGGRAWPRRARPPSSLSAPPASPIARSCPAQPASIANSI